MTCTKCSMPVHDYIVSPISRLQFVSVCDTRNCMDFKLIISNAFLVFCLFILFLFFRPEYKFKIENGQYIKVWVIFGIIIKCKYLKKNNIIIKSMLRCFRVRILNLVTEINFEIYKI